MAKKRHISIETPSLFDDFDTPADAPAEVKPAKKEKPESVFTATPLPVHPDIAKRVQQELNIQIKEKSANETPEVDDDSVKVAPIDRLLFISFGSGSSGCCAYLGTEEEGIIIDAGIDAKKVVDSLKSNGIAPSVVKGIILTHDHRDHVAFAYTLAKRLNKERRNAENVLIHSSLHTLKGMLLRHNISIRVKDLHKPFFLETAFKIGDFTITPFAVSHDGLNDTAFGFHIALGGYTFALATDTGCPTDGMRRYLADADYIMIESNYDSEMLRTGRYPEYLKARIRSEKGHSDNDDCAHFLAEIYSPRLKHIFLCHLSEENNTPELARNASLKALTDKGVNVGEGQNTLDDRQADVQLSVLPRRDISPLYTFRKD